MVTTIFAFTGAVVALGFLGNLLFNKTGIPDVLILVLLGIVLGPIFHVVQPGGLAPLAPLFSTLALVIILFEGALHLSLYKVLEESPKAFALAVLGIAFSIAVCTAAAVLLLQWEITEGLLLGAVLGGSSSSIVITLVARSGSNDRVVTLLTLESAFTDAIVIVLTISLLQIATTATTDANPVSTALRSMASGFSVGAVVGLLSGVFWARLLTTVGGQKYIDILTLCTVLVVYAVVESIGGNGAIAVLFFGLSLANGRDILTMLRRPPPAGTDTLPVHFMSELSFFMRTFFFVYLGFIATVSDYRLMITGALIGGLLLAGRWVASLITAIGDTELRRNVAALTFMLPRGLAAAVMGQLVAESAFPHGSTLISVVTVTIITTVGIGALGTVYLARKKPEGDLERLLADKSKVSA